MKIYQQEKCLFGHLLLKLFVTSVSTDQTLRQNCNWFLLKCFFKTLEISYHLLRISIAVHNQIEQNIVVVVIDNNPIDYYTNYSN